MNKSTRWTFGGEQWLPLTRRKGYTSQFYEQEIDVRRRAKVPADLSKKTALLGFASKRWTFGGEQWLPLTRRKGCTSQFRGQGIDVRRRAKVTADLSKKTALFGFASKRQTFGGEQWLPLTRQKGCISRIREQEMDVRRRAKVTADLSKKTALLGFASTRQTFGGEQWLPLTRQKGCISRIREQEMDVRRRAKVTADLSKKTALLGFASKRQTFGGEQWLPLTRRKMATFPGFANKGFCALGSLSERSEFEQVPKSCERNRWKCPFRDLKRRPLLTEERPIDGSERNEMTLEDGK